MLESLEGRTYTVHLAGELGSVLSLPLLDHGTFNAVENAVTDGYARLSDPDRLVKRAAQRMLPGSGLLKR